MMQRRDFLTFCAPSAALGCMLRAHESRAPGDGLRKQVDFGRGIRDRKSVATWLSGPIQSFRPSFNEDGSIDYQGVRNFVDRSIEGGSKTVLMTAGDSHLICLTDSEIAQLTKVVCEQTAGRAMVVAADWDSRTASAVEFAKYAGDIGASVLMTRPADWSSSCTASSLAAHYIQVSRHLPVMLVTNSFSQRGEDFGIQAVREAVEGSDKVVAVKDDLLGDFAKRLCGVVQGTGVVAFAGGMMQNHLLMLKYGCGDCYMSTFLAFAPSITKRYWAAIQANDLEEATRIVEEYEKPFFDLLDELPSGWNAGMHGVLALFGITKKFRPKPYQTVTEPELERLTDFLRRKKLL